MKKKKDIKKQKNKYDFPFEFQRLLDIEQILKKTKNKDKLKVILKKDNIKGTGLFATKQIKEDEIIAYYKIKVFNEAHYNSPTNYIYTFSIYGKNDKPFKNQIGDISEDSIPKPENNIPYWGPFINEPSDNQDINAHVDTNYDFNFKAFNRTKVKSGTYLIYNVVASRDIDEGEEITIYYGDEYERDYILNIKSHDD